MTRPVGSLEVYVIGKKWLKVIIGPTKQHKQQSKNFQNCFFPLYIYIYSLYISVRVGVGVDFLEVAVQAKLCCSSDYTEFYSRALFHYSNSASP